MKIHKKISYFDNSSIESPTKAEKSSCSQFLQNSEFDTEHTEFEERKVRKSSSEDESEEEEDNKPWSFGEDSAGTGKKTFSEGSVESEELLHKHGGIRVLEKYRRKDKKKKKSKAL